MVKQFEATSRVRRRHADGSTVSQSQPPRKFPESESAGSHRIYLGTTRTIGTRAILLINRSR
jgi:hypothetical protein